MTFDRTGPHGFMVYWDLWWFNLIVLIFYKSSLGFMGEHILCHQFVWLRVREGTLMARR